MNTFQGSRAPLIRDLYVPVLQQVLDEHRIASPSNRPSPVVGPYTSFDEVVRNTAWYCWLADTQPHYRYRRYQEVLQRIRLLPGDYRVVHLDIGCGAGLFSWAFLDWARNGQLDYGRVALYGFDHSPEMINLAHEMRNQLAQSVSDYPDLRYTSDATTLLQDLPQEYQNGAICIITFGHVLVQAQDNDPSDIAGFAQIITQIAQKYDRCNCVLVAVDAKGWPVTFASGWSTLISNLTASGVHHKMFSFRRTSINDDDRAKIALLFSAGGQGG